jgi:hypothetical protein
MTDSQDVLRTVIKRRDGDAWTVVRLADLKVGDVITATYPDGYTTPVSIVDTQPHVVDGQYGVFVKPLGDKNETI